MKIRISFLALLLFSLPTQAATHTYSPEPGITLRYIVAKPRKAKNEKLPVWFFQSGDGSILQKFSPLTASFLANRLANKLHAIFVFPELRRELYANQLLNYCQLDFFHRTRDLNKLIDLTKTESRVDTNRIYLFGHSAGSEIVTLVANQRSDIAGVATYGGGVASANERKNIPNQIPALLENQCDDASTYTKRSGIFWKQLFYESNLFQTIQALKQPYLAMLGSEDLGDGLDSEFAAEIRKTKPNFDFKVIPDMNHGLGMNLAPWKAAAEFFSGH